MYFSPTISRQFAALEQNEKNYQVAEIIDNLCIQETSKLPDSLTIAELGGGAHPDRYHELFSRILKTPHGHIDWVDVSPLMLNLAKKYLQTSKYQERFKVITFIEAEILDYLKKQTDEKFDLVIMKYTLDHIKNINILFNLLAKKLKKGGKMIATMTNLNPQLKSISTNARFLFNGQEFPDHETRTLKDGDSFTVKFFKESGNPQAGYLEGAETRKYFHSKEKIKYLAKTLGFNIFLGDYKKILKQNQQKNLDLDILLLSK